MKLDQKKLETLAIDAKIDLDGKVKSYENYLKETLTWLEKIHDIEVENIEPAGYIQPTVNEFREDEVLKKFAEEKNLDNVSDTKGSYIKVPKIMQQEEV